MAMTKIADLINPEVMADMISAKVENAIVVTPFARIDNTLAGQAGDTITAPYYDYIGDAVDVSEGDSVTPTKLNANYKTYRVKKAMQAVELTDEAVLSGYGNPVGETNTQLVNAIASKVDSDAIDALSETSNVYDGTANIISYSGVIDAIDLFNEEMNTDKVMFIHPKQMSQLRKDKDFISADKYNQQVILRGEIGMIANTRIIPSRRVHTVDGTAGSRTVTVGGTIAVGDKFSIAGKEFVAAATTAASVATGLAAAINADTAMKFTASASNAVVTLTEATGYHGVGLTNAPVLAKTSAAGTLTAGGTYSGTCNYVCPIVKLEADSRTEDEVPALTIYLKRDTNVETERDTLKRSTKVSVDKLYVAALTNVSKCVLAKFASVASV